jgi:hypothetical protein
MFRRSDLKKVGNYTTDRAFYEDYDLWSRFSQIGDVSNLREVLVDYRHHEKGLSKSTSYFRDDAVFNQSYKNIKKLLNSDELVYSDLSAVYHFRKDKYRNSSYSSLSKALDRIAEQLNRQYPKEVNLIAQREAQYKRIMRYRLNALRRQIDPSPFKLFLLKVENRIFPMQPELKNED